MTATVNQSYCTYLFITSILIIMIWPSFGGLLYGIEKQGTLFTVDVTTQNYNEIGVTNIAATQIRELEYDCINDKMYVSADNGDDGRSLVSEISLNDASEFSSVIVSGQYKALEYVDHSTLYGWNQNDAWHHGLRILNPLTGTARFISTDLSDDIGVPGGIAYDIETNTMYAITTAGNTESLLLTIDLDSGEPATVVPTEIEAFSSLTFADNGVLYGGTSTGNDIGKIYQIDPDTSDTTELIDIKTDHNSGNDFKIVGLTWVSDDGCPTKEPTAFPSAAPTEPTLIPTITTLSPTNSPTNDSSNDSSNDE